MSQVVPYASAPLRPVLEKSRAGGLVAFGVISIVIGSGLLLIGAIGIVGLYMMARMGPAGTADATAALAGMMILIAVLAALLFWVGIGSIRCRRWVRPVILPLAWAWLVSGLLAVVTMAAAGFADHPNQPASTTVTIQGTGATPTVATTNATPATPSATAPATQPAAAVRPQTAEIIFIIAAMSLVALALPLAYILFYRSPNVRRTLDAYDPHPRWTDRCPTPLLGVAIWSVLLALGAATGALAGYSDFFGNYLTGWGAAAVAAVKVGMLAAAAVLFFNRNPIGWWVALAYVLLWGTSLVTTQLFGEVETIRAAAQAVGDEDQLHPAARRATAGLYAAGVIAGIAYLLYVRRWFHTAQAPTAPAPNQQFAQQLTPASDN